MFALVLALFMLAACGAGNAQEEASEPSGKEAVAVRIGTPATGDKGARMLECARAAAEKQYFEEELAKAGYVPEYYGFEGAGPAVNEAMIAGDLDIAIYGDMPAVVLASKFDGVKWIAMDNSAVQQGIVVQKDSGIKSAADLKGKKVIAETGTTCQKFLISYLENAGLSESDIEEINATTANAQTEFAAGAVDAVVLPCMAAYRLVNEKEVGEILVVAGNEEYLQSQYVVAARTDFLEKHPEAAEAVIRALIRGQEFAAENPEQIYELFADSRYSADVYRSVYSFDDSFAFFDPEPTEACAEKLKALVSYALDKGLIKNSVDVDTVLDRSYYDAAVK